ncbi:hypothetical protein KKIDH5335_12230 [Vibrio fluvialis]|nr:hypothetical protein KKIDH5335_12230 [Vibrio fluvialis]
MVQSVPTYCEILALRAKERQFAVILRGQAAYFSLFYKVGDDDDRPSETSSASQDLYRMRAIVQLAEKVGAVLG